MPHWNFHYLISVSLAVINVVLLSASLRFQHLNSAIIYYLGLLAIFDEETSDTQEGRASRSGTRYFSGKGNVQSTFQDESSAHDGLLLSCLHRSGSYSRRQDYSSFIIKKECLTLLFKAG